MNIFRQDDPRWNNKQLGSCSKETIGKSGCAITCVAMLTELTPLEINELAVYRQGCLINWKATADRLGMQYDERTDQAVFYPTVAEVKVKSGQHFVVVNADGTQYDPLTGEIGANRYKILGWRNISLKQAVQEPTIAIDKGKLIKELGKFVGVDYSDNDKEFLAHLKNPNLPSMLNGFFKSYGRQIKDKIILVVNDTEV
jgi:hypothetical protein